MTMCNYCPFSLLFSSKHYLSSSSRHNENSIQSQAHLSMQSWSLNWLWYCSIVRHAKRNWRDNRNKTENVIYTCLHGRKRDYPLILDLSFLSGFIFGQNTFVWECWVTSSPRWSSKQTILEGFTWRNESLM